MLDQFTANSSRLRFNQKISSLLAVSVGSGLRCVVSLVSPRIFDMQLSTLVTMTTGWWHIGSIWRDHNGLGWGLRNGLRHGVFICQRNLLLQGVHYFSQRRALSNTIMILYNDSERSWPVIFFELRVPCDSMNAMDCACLLLWPCTACVRRVLIEAPCDYHVIW